MSAGREDAAAAAVTRGPVRTLVIRFPDWPVAAQGAAPEEPAAVLVANRVIATTPAARAAGVTVGMRRRDAQGRCPELAILERDLDREARAFEPVVVAATRFTPRVEIRWPGACSFGTRGPSRYFGGDLALAEAVAVAVDDALVPSPWHCRVGVADGPFAAELATRMPAAGPRRDCDPTAPVVVPPGETAAFLAPLPLTAVDRPALVEVLGRLGLRTVGDFAALDPAVVVGRFGREGQEAHRLARGLDDRPPDLRPPPPDLAAVAELDPPVERVDQAAFVAKSLADELAASLEEAGLACLRLAVEAETEHGETRLRLWRHEGALSAGAMAERVRWQLEGWLDAAPDARPTAGLLRISLVPDQIVPARGRQLGFWGGESRSAERASRAVSRVAGLLGPDAVRVPEPRGGRSPAEQWTLVPATAVELAERSLPAGKGPWPGRLPSPSPARVGSAVPVEVVDAGGRPVQVGGRGTASGEPAFVAVAGGRPQAVTAWAGPWPVEERWWDPVGHRRQARFQVVLEDGTAHLLVLEGGTWSLTATYD